MAAWTTQGIRDQAIELLLQRGWDPLGTTDEGRISADQAVSLAAVAAGEPSDRIPEPEGPYLSTMRELESLIGRGSLLDWEMQGDRTVEQVIELLRSGTVAGGAYPPLTADEQAEHDRRLAELGAAARRMFDAQRQMTERSGPIYETARKRGRFLSEAYRAAGRPSHVIKAPPWDSPAYLRRIGHGRDTRFEPATEEEWLAWDRWVRERERLRRELRVGRDKTLPRG